MTNEKMSELIDKVQKRTSLKGSANLLVHSGSIDWDPFIFTDKSSAEKFYTTNKKAATREYRVIYDLTCQTAELGLNTDTAKLDWSDSYQIVARAMY